jgi:hypothetical protein
MSARAECPLCGYCSAAVEVPHPLWGEAFRQAELENATDVPDGGRMTFWCPCGRMMWMEGMGWLVMFDFVVRLADWMPQEIARVTGGPVITPPPAESGS